VNVRELTVFGSIGFTRYGLRFEGSWLSVKNLGL
jgi:hypothetical protein